MTDHSFDLTQAAKTAMEFRDARDWKQFHSPRNLAAALSIEAAELQEIFLWRKDESSVEIAEKPELMARIRDELADVMVLALTLSSDLGIDLNAAILEKIEKNGQRYTVEKYRGSARKAEHNEEKKEKRVTKSIPVTVEESLFDDIDDFMAEIKEFDRLIPERLTLLLARGKTDWHELSVEDKAGSKGTQFLNRILRSLDRLLVHTMYDPFHSMIEKAASHLVTRLILRIQRRETFKFSPGPVLGTSTTIRNIIPDNYLERRLVYSRVPKEKIIGVLRRAHLQDQKIIEDENNNAIVYVSIGNNDEDFKALVVAYREMVLCAQAKAEWSHEELSPIRKYLMEPSRLNDKQRKKTLQYALNHFYKLGLHKQMHKACLRLQERILSHGFQEIPGCVGQHFGGAFPKSDYEAIHVNSEKQAGTVIDIRRPGFKDETGATVQRVQVLVSNGLG
ncbi:MAG: nucleotide pyrophosphohydrolase [Planctomycetota bacterium]|nr:nucleotide pyrophosphohydrolase [Planctomycetota bacterium]